MPRMKANQNSSIKPDQVTTDAGTEEINMTLLLETAKKCTVDFTTDKELLIKIDDSWSKVLTSWGFQKTRNYTLDQMMDFACSYKVGKQMIQTTKILLDKSLKDIAAMDELDTKDKLI